MRFLPSSLLPGTVQGMEYLTETEDGDPAFRAGEVYRTKRFLKLERQIDRRPPRFLLALALSGLGRGGYYLAPRPSGAPGRLGNLPEPQKNRLRQTKIGNALTGAARWRGLISIEMRPNDQNDNGPI